MKPNIIAQNNPQTIINTSPRTIRTGSEIFDFFFAPATGATPGTAGEAGG